MGDLCNRFTIAKDMNGDLLFTISDLWLQLGVLFHLPSNALMELLSLSPDITSFFEIDCQTGQGVGGAIFSVFLWLTVITGGTQAVQNK